MFKPVIVNAEQLAGLGLSEQCEHTNRELIHKAQYSLHYDNSESIDLVVKATVVFKNEGRHSDYIQQVIQLF